LRQCGGETNNNTQILCFVNSIKTMHDGKEKVIGFDSLKFA